MRGLPRAAVSATQAPFLAEVELCGSVFATDPHWRCYNEPPLDGEEAWLRPAFEDDRWRPAAWAPRSVEVPAMERHGFEKGARFVLPAPVLDAQADAAWQAWAQTKEEANEAWRAWRAAKEGQRGEKNETTAAAGAAGVDGAAAASESMEHNSTASVGEYISSMRGGGGGGGDGGSKPLHVAEAAGNATPSLDWKDHAPNTTNGLQRLEWHKPRPAAVHGYYCRLELPNPTRAYALELQGLPGAPKKAGASALA
jgi:hypothetical protein